MSEVAYAMPVKRSGYGLVQAATMVMLCCGLFVITGCTRTSDGSVEFSAPSLRPGLLRRDASKVQANPIIPAPFPPEPAPPAEPVSVVRQQATRRPAQSKPRETARPAPKTVERTEKPLLCGQRPQPGGRVKVVCE